MGENQKAIKYSKEALKYYENDESYKSVILLNIGMYNLNMNKYDSASYYLMESLRLKEITNDSLGIVIVSTNLASLFIEMKDYAKALNYNAKSLEMALAIDDARGIGDAYYKYATIYSNQNDTTLAINYYLKSVKIYEQNIFLKPLLVCYNSIGDEYRKQGNYEKAEEYFLLGLQIAVEQNLVEEIASFNHRIAELLGIKKEWGKALLYINKAIDGYKLIDSKNRSLLFAFQKKAEILFYLKKYELAYLYSDSSIVLSNLIYSENTQKIVQELEIKYETEKKEQQIKLQQIEKQELVARNELLKRNQLLFLLIFGFFLLLSIGFILFARYRRKQKLQRLQEEQKRQREKEIEEMKLQIKEQESNAISKELHDGQCSILSGIIRDLHSKDTDKKFQREINVIRNVYNEIRNLSHILASPDFSISDIDDKLKEFFRNIQENQKLDVKFNFPVNCKKIDTKIKYSLLRIIYELTENTLKHADASNIDIAVTKHENLLSIIYYDNGKGFDINTNTEGIGLKNIKSHIKVLNGTLEIDSQPGDGTTFIVDIPLNSK